MHAHRHGVQTLGGGTNQRKAMPPSIDPVSAKKIKRLMWVHVVLTMLSLAVLGYMSWWVWGAEPKQLVVAAALLILFRELARGYWVVFTHWVSIRAEAKAFGIWLRIRP